MNSMNKFNGINNENENINFNEANKGKIKTPNK
jgi:hypothetical protein